MKNAQLKALGAELDTVVRLRGLEEAVVIGRVMRFIDFEFHGVRDLVDETEQLDDAQIARKGPRKPPQAGT